MDILREILTDSKLRAEARERAVPLEEIRARLHDVPPPRDFLSALRVAHNVALICEMKRRSPSKGDLFPDLDPKILASQYQSGGASCLSVLCEPNYFGGSFDDLKSAKEGCTLPILQKDFIISPYQIYEGRAQGADAQLLIVAALTDDDLLELYESCIATNQTPLLEVHMQEELDRALALAPELVGINNRDLATFAVSLETAERLLPQLPATCLGVAESGIFLRDDVLRMQRAGAEAILVGEALVTSGDPEASTRVLLGD